MLNQEGGDSGRGARRCARGFEEEDRGPFSRLVDDQGERMEGGKERKKKEN